MVAEVWIWQAGKGNGNLVWELAYNLTNSKMYFEHMSFWGLDDVF